MYRPARFAHDLEPANGTAFDASVLKQVATEVRMIKAEYRGVVSERSIDLVAQESLQHLAGSKVPQFVALFVGRITRERLWNLTGFRPRIGFDHPGVVRAAS